MGMKRIKGSLVLCLATLVLLTALDLISKEWATENLSQERIGKEHPICTPDERGLMHMQRVRDGKVVLVKNILEFRYAENCGAAFGLLNETPGIFRTSLFMTAAAVAISFLLWMFVRGSGGPLFAISVPFVVSGALGNVIDRILHGFVVDFIRFRIYSYFEWPTFNVADIAITIGVILLFLDGFRNPHKEEEKAEDESLEGCASE